MVKGQYLMTPSLYLMINSGARYIDITSIQTILSIICDPILENQPYRGNYDSEQ